MARLLSQRLVSASQRRPAPFAGRRRHARIDVATEPARAARRGKSRTRLTERPC
jgi:hypothetical protein